MQKWEYFDVACMLKIEEPGASRWEWADEPKDDSIGSRLNRYGQQGWELVCILGDLGIGLLYFFKRPLPSSSGED
jgi:hypothetical protein